MLNYIIALSLDAGFVALALDQRNHDPLYWFTLVAVGGAGIMATLRAAWRR